jgi:hypothetical protein
VGKHGRVVLFRNPWLVSSFVGYFLSPARLRSIQFSLSEYETSRLIKNVLIHGKADTQSDRPRSDLWCNEILSTRRPSSKDYMQYVVPVGHVTNGWSTLAKAIFYFVSVLAGERSLGTHKFSIHSVSQWDDEDSDFNPIPGAIKDQRRGQQMSICRCRGEHLFR